LENRLVTEKRTPGVEVVGAKIVNMPGTGIKVTGSGSALIVDSETSHNGGDGLHIEGVIDAEVRGHRAHYNRGHGIFVASSEARKLAEDMRLAVEKGATAEDLKSHFGRRLMKLGGAFEKAMGMAGSAADILSFVMGLVGG
jgi:hypothetical protein